MPTIAANGIEFAVEIAGPSGAPPIVFVHALGASKESWREQIAAFAGRYRCIAYDARGHGATTPGPMVPHVAALADDLRGVLDALGIQRATIAGISIGGMTAQHFAATHPERVERLILLSTTAKTVDGEPFRSRARDVRATGLDAVAKATMTRWFSAAFAAAHPARVEDVRRRFVATDRECYALAAEAVGGFDAHHLLGRITAPTLVVVGAQDPGTPPEVARDLADRIGGATLVVIPDAAHMVTVEAAKPVAAYVGAFLDLGREPGTRPSATFEDGLANRRAVLGDAYVDRALASAGGVFGAPWQDFVTRIAWAELWGDPALRWRERSMLTLALLMVLNREEEFRLHVRGALRNGVAVEELQALIRHAAGYAGAAAGNNANRWAIAALAEMEEEAEG
ncbi:MAG: alpha/beta fold hydrolase [Bauldia sp.]|nr:alpha/beta fold hydrolase [Bauldia sp.]